MGNRTSAVLQAVKRRKRGVANVVSVGAIGALAVGTLGTGVATAQNMVGSPDIKNQSIRSWDIHRDAVGQSELRGAHDDRGPAVKSHQVANENLLHWDIKNGTLQPQDFSQKAKDALKGEQGPKGEKGDQGPKGEPGQDGVSGYEVVGRNSDRVTVAVGERVTITTLCASEDSSDQQQSEKALGGGAKAVEGAVVTNDTHPHAIDQVSEPDEDDPAGRWAAGGWAVTVTNNGGGEAVVQPYVTCALMN